MRLCLSSGGCDPRPDRAGQQELYFGGRGVFHRSPRNGAGNRSGKLVTQVKLDLLKHAPETDLAILDGSPGIGCPVIASVSGMDLVLVVAGAQPVRAQRPEAAGCHGGGPPGQDCGMRQQVGCEPRTHPGDPGILYGGGHPLCGGGPL